VPAHQVDPGVHVPPGPRRRSVARHHQKAGESEARHHLPHVRHRLDVTHDLHLGDLDAPLTSSPFQDGVGSTICFPRPRLRVAHCGSPFL